VSDVIHLAAECGCCSVCERLGVRRTTDRKLVTCWECLRIIANERRARALPGDEEGR
jgi:hypothetical protein